MFNEKIIKTVHFAIGDPHYNTDNGNKSIMHWDLIVDMKNGGLIYFDDKLIQKDGIFVDDRLAKLNYERNERIKKYKDLSVMNKINIKEILGNDNSSQKKALLIEKNDIEKKINQKDNISQGMYEDLKTGIIDYEEYKVFKENFKNEKNTLVTRLEIVNKQLSELENAEFNFEEAGKIFEKYNSIKEVTREIINEFIEKIIVGEYNPNTKSRDIKIKWKYQF